MTQKQLETYLGRSLTAREVDNLKDYLELAKDTLESLLCINLDCKVVSEARTFDYREGMSTVFTDIFTEVQKVEINNQEVEFTPYFWSKRNNNFFNSVVLKNKPHADVTITADWGFDELPADLMSLLAQMFALVSKKKTVGSVKSKDVRNFRITFGSESDIEKFTIDNEVTISKYSMCDLGEIRSGKVC